jgi:hypothetical protein
MIAWNDSNERYVGKVTNWNNIKPVSVQKKKEKREYICHETWLHISATSSESTTTCFLLRVSGAWMRAPEFLSLFLDLCLTRLLSSWRNVKDWATYCHLLIIGRTSNAMTVFSAKCGVICNRPRCINWRYFIQSINYSLYILRIFRVECCFGSVSI